MADTLRPVVINTQIFGLKELEEAVKKLQTQMAGKEGRPMNNAARHVLKKAILPRAKNAAPESDPKTTPLDWYTTESGKWAYKGEEFSDPGRLKNAIFYKPEPHPRKYAVVGYVGVRHGKRNDPNSAWYAPIVNFRGGKGGRGRYFMTNAINQEQDSRLFAYQLAGSVQRLARKIGDENMRQLAHKIRAAHKPG